MDEQVRYHIGAAALLDALPKAQWLLCERMSVFGKPQHRLNVRNWVTPGLLLVACWMEADER